MLCPKCHGSRVYEREALVFERKRWGELSARKTVTLPCDYCDGAGQVSCCEGACGNDVPDAPE